MAKDQLRDFHLFAMESALPFGFQVDGATSAKTVREKIDQLIPGLGYPVVSVDVTVEENCQDYESNDQDSLVLTLNRIDSELDQLRSFLHDDSLKIDDQ